MENKNTVLVLGHGVMGMFLVPELSKMGFRVQVICLEKVESTDPNVTFTQANCKDPAFLKPLMESGRYDAVVDFMLYTTEEFRSIHPIFLENTRQYIFLSSYRVYSSLELPIRETSPQMLDVSDDQEYLAHEDEYSLYKARKERILLSSGYSNYTIIRPSIVYSRVRFQLTTLEAPVFMTRAWQGKTIILPEAAMDVEATMTWGGDAGKMIARLVLNPKALGQAYTVCTAEHHTWREVAQIYHELFGLEYVTVDTETFLRFFGNGFLARYTLLYDRCARRIMDNSKILEATGLRQSDLMSLKEGLRLEYNALPPNKVWPASPINDAMDAYLAKGGIL